MLRVPSTITKRNRRCSEWPSHICRSRPSGSRISRVICENVATPHGGLAPVRANRKVALLSTAYSWTLGLPKWEIDENPYYGVRHNRDRLKRREGGHACSLWGFKSRWAYDMKRYRETGGQRFSEHDLCAKKASDPSTARAQELLDHASLTITRRVYSVRP